MSQHDDINNPSHYQLAPGIEAWDVIRATLTDEELRGYCLGNLLKYRLRAGEKQGQDPAKCLAKANWYRDRLRDLAKGRAPDDGKTREVAQHVTGGPLSWDGARKFSDDELLRRIDAVGAGRGEIPAAQPGPLTRHFDQIFRDLGIPREANRRMACAGSNEPAEERVIPKAENDALLAALRGFDLDARASDIRIFALTEIDSVLCKEKTPLEAANSIAAATRKMLESRP